MLRPTLLVAVLLLSGCTGVMGAESVRKPRLEGLKELVATSPDARDLYEGIQADADAALHEKPNPIKTIVSEGHLGSDPNRIRTYQSLPDMDKITALAGAAAATGDPKYLEKLKEFLLAWASTNVSEGDPINDTKLEPAFVAYGDFRSAFSPEQRHILDRWLHDTAETLITAIPQRPDCIKNNWMSHRLKMIGLAAFILHDGKLRTFTVNRYRQQIADNLLADGSSIDLVDRDALHYHCYDLEPLLTLAIAADEAGIDLYSYQASTGASLPKSVAYLVPFCDGTKQHPEFIHSKVDFDRQRAASGDTSYKAGRPFDPHMGLHSMELAAYFDARQLPVVAKLAETRRAQYPTWQYLCWVVGKAR